MMDQPRIKPGDRAALLHEAHRCTVAAKEQARLLLSAIDTLHSSLSSAARDLEPAPLDRDVAVLHVEHHAVTRSVLTLLELVDHVVDSLGGYARGVEQGGGVLDVSDPAKNGGPATRRTLRGARSSRGATE